MLPQPGLNLKLTMATESIRVLEPLHRGINLLATRDCYSIKQFLFSAGTGKLASLTTDDYRSEQAKRAELAESYRLQGMAPNGQPDVGNGRFPSKRCQLHPICNPRFGRVVGRHFHFHAVADDEADEAFPHFAGDVGEDDLFVDGQLDLEHGAGQHLHDGAVHFDFAFGIDFLRWGTAEAAGIGVGTWWTGGAAGTSGAVIIVAAGWHVTGERVIPRGAV